MPRGIPNPANGGLSHLEAKMAEIQAALGAIKARQRHIKYLVTYADKHGLTAADVGEFYKQMRERQRAQKAAEPVRSRKPLHKKKK